MRSQNCCLGQCLVRLQSCDLAQSARDSRHDCARHALPSRVSHPRASSSQLQSRSLPQSDSDSRHDSCWDDSDYRAPIRLSSTGISRGPLRLAHSQQCATEGTHRNAAIVLATFSLRACKHCWSKTPVSNLAACCSNSVAMAGVLAVQGVLVRLAPCLAVE